MSFVVFKSGVEVKTISIVGLILESCEAFHMKLIWLLPQIFYVMKVCTHFFAFLNSLRIFLVP